MHTPIAGKGVLGYLKRNGWSWNAFHRNFGVQRSGELQVALEKCGAVEFIPSRANAFTARLAQIRLNSLVLLVRQRSVPKSFACI
jgi:hypothetical protein